MKSHDFERIAVPIYFISCLLIMICWMKYELLGLTASFLICLLPIVKCSKKYWCGSEEFGLDGYGMYHESILFRLTKRKRR